MSFFRQFRSIISKATPAADNVPQQESGKPAVQLTEPVERRRRKRLNSHKGRRVLIVDDSPTIVAVLKKTLRSAGCVTLEALDAEHGLEIVRREKPDLVFLDIVLPGMHGFAALRLMRRDPATQHIPVIMISGNEQATEQFYAKRIGADDFMKKPFSRFEVFGRMDSLVEIRKLASIGQNEIATNLPEIPATPDPAAAAASPASPVANTVATAVTPAFAATAAQQMATQPLQAATRPQTEPYVRAAPSPAAAPLAISTPAMTAFEARSQLSAMGLQYFNQEHFLAAQKRGDKLAIDLFITGGGVNVNS